MTLSTEFISFVAPFLSGAAGVGFAYGALKTRLNGIDKRVEKNETRLETRGVTKEDLHMRCNDCHTSFLRSLDDIKTTIRELREELDRTRENLPKRVAEHIRTVWDLRAG